MMDMVDSEITSERLRQPGQVAQGVAAEPRRHLTPAVAVLSVGVGELVLDVEQPHPARPGDHPCRRLGRQVHQDTHPPALQGGHLENG